MSVALGEIVTPVNTWNPERDTPGKSFIYIDLSAVDQNTKTIVGAREVPCAEAPSRARQIVAAGDVLVSTVRPNLNGVARVPLEMDGATASTGFCVLRPRPEKLDGAYLFHWVRSPRFIAEMVRRATGASYPAVSDGIVCSTKLPLLPLPEQQRIAEVLDRTEALRAKRRAALDQLDTLIQALFLDIFDDPRHGEWPRTALPNAFWFQEGPGVRMWQFKAEGIKLLNVGNIEKDGSLNLTKTDRYLAQEEAFGKYKHFLVDAGDLVIASSGISFDEDGMLRTRGAFVSEQQLPLCMNTSTIRFKALDNVSDLRFLWAWLNSREFRAQITKCVTGSAQQNFGPSHLSSLMITLPPLAVQRWFARRVAAVEKLKTVHRASLAEMDALFASLQHRAFRGEL